MGRNPHHIYLLPFRLLPLPPPHLPSTLLNSRLDYIRFIDVILPEQSALQLIQGLYRCLHLHRSLRPALLTLFLLPTHPDHITEGQGLRTRTPAQSRALLLESELAANVGKLQDCVFRIIQSDQRSVSFPEFGVPTLLLR